MTTPTVATVEKMLESLPKEAQQRVVEHLQEYIQDLQDEKLWSDQFEGTQEQLVKAARRARSEIAAGKAVLMDFDRL